VVEPTPLKNISQWEGLSHILWKNQNVPNHQPVIEVTAEKYEFVSWDYEIPN